MTTALRSRYPEYFSKSTEQLNALLDTALIVFDASVLLNLYQYSATGREKLRTQLLPERKRIWLLDQAATEYCRNRRRIVEPLIRVASSMVENLEKSMSELIKKWEKSFGEHVEASLKEIEQLVAGAVQGMKGAVSKLPAPLASLEDDPVLALVEELVEGRITNSYSATELDEIYAAGEIRYSKGAPPGFCDTSKEGVSKYGDSVFWTQAIDLAKSQQTSLLIVTDDAKKDWWLIDGNKTIGPHPALVREMREIAKQDTHVYRMNEFLKHLGALRETPPPQELTDEVQAVERKNEDRRSAATLVAAAYEAAQAFSKAWEASGIEQYRSTLDQASIVFEALTGQSAFQEIMERQREYQRVADELMLRLPHARDKDDAKK